MGDLGVVAPMPYSPRDLDSVRRAIEGSDIVINLIGKDYETSHYLPSLVNYSWRDVHVTVPETIAKVSAEMVRGLEGRQAPGKEWSLAWGCWAVACDMPCLGAAPVSHRPARSPHTHTPARALALTPLSLPAPAPHPTPPSPQGVTCLVHMSALGADPRGLSAWARSKAEGEAAVRAVAPGAVIMRPADVFGAEDRFLNTIATLHGRLGGRVPLVDGGTARVQPLFVHDLAQAVFKVAMSEDPEFMLGQTYDLAGACVRCAEVWWWELALIGGD